MIYICESCDYGYAEASTCPHCGTSNVMAHRTLPVERVCDTECYKDYWLCSFSTEAGEVTSFEMFPGKDLDRDGLTKILSKTRIVTFNGTHYDVPMISLALSGANNQALKNHSDCIIVGSLKAWQHDYPIIDVDHIDLFEVAPGMASLKMYAGKMHARKMQDLPIDPSASIDLFDRIRLREYCENDLSNTWLLRRAMSSQITLREQMTAKYGVDLRSKSDAQIAEAAMKSILGAKIQPATVTPGVGFQYRAPVWLKFLTLDILDVVNRSHFRIDHNGYVAMPDELADRVIHIGASKYKMGIGGLHSMEQRSVHIADETYRISDHDVASYYPSLILETGIFPPQIGVEFQSIYRGWYKQRMDAKAAGDTKNANSLKTLLNGTFGKLGNRYSIFYAPSELIQVTITGQLGLLMLIERLEMCGMRVISGNTDGIVILSRRDMEWLRDDCIRWWEQTTGFVTEATEYRGMFSRDVNSYVAITTDGKAKLKGAYAPAAPGASGWPNPTTQVCVDAVVAYLKDGVPVADTITKCTDVRQFVSIRNVKGGGMCAGEYLGKAVRWYYAYGSKDYISYRTNGNKVAKTDGCAPLMTLPDELPSDLDYAW
jgi:hypothetical protein